MSRFLGFDTETIRLPSGSRAPELCQIAMISDEVERHDPADRILDLRELVLTVDPEADPEHWDEQAIAIHGIRPEDAEGHGTFLEIFPRLCDLALGAEILVGYNLSFDVAVLQAALRRYGLETHFPWPRVHVDVMDLAMDKLRLEGKRGQKAPTLGEIYQHVMGEPLRDAHDALADIRATLAVWEKLRV